MESFGTSANGYFDICAGPGYASENAVALRYSVKKLSLMKCLRPATSLKKDSNTGVFL